MTLHFWSAGAELPGIGNRTVCRRQAIACEVHSDLHSPTVAAAEGRPHLRGSTNSVRRNRTSSSIWHTRREQNRSNRGIVARVCVHPNEPCTVGTGTLQDKRCRQAVPLRIVESVH